ncbi:NAD(P)/FAD-dependent oxidoreductase [Paraburkholderia pallida]|uniref:FAD-binding oxidoreductase n=1 Tax=Paraburkholderia pallida TaxID=2547399 RepID=A0A4P7D0T1_9BURK|nr:FAD-binding oxidoreductase [Paraburkholderia pallida]QBR02199.1 FAD-binding oxidoreductase [Paraburkholderia pallida]
METNRDAVIVIGAGVVGMATALFLQRAGKTVTVIDPFPPAGGCSFGNAGMISANNATPIAMPGMLSRVPGWLLDPDGPLVLRKRYFLKVAPWLLKWISAGRIDRVMEISDAMRALAKDTHEYWKDLVGPQRYVELIRRNGQVHLAATNDMPPRNARAEQAIRERHGTQVEILDADQIREMFPGIARDITRGVIVPGNGYTTNPARLVGSIGEAFLNEGGKLVSEKALKLIPKEKGIMVMTNIANRHAADVVIAAGVFSHELLKPFGISVPLEGERGYHATLPGTNLKLQHTLTVRSRGLGITPMEMGIRITGAVELCDRYDPPEESIAMRYVSQAKALFPNLTHDEPTVWMGMRPSLPDSLPVIGPVSAVPGLHLAFGNSHFGMTNGPATARIAADLVLGEQSRIDATPYRLARFG